MNLDDFERHLFLTQPFGSPMREALERTAELSAEAAYEAAEEARIAAYEEGKRDAPEVRELAEELDTAKEENSKLHEELTKYRAIKWQLHSLTRRKLKKDELIAAIHTLYTQLGAI